MSNYVTSTLEAFAVLLYYNSFEVWNSRYKSDNSQTSNESVDADDFSAMTGATGKWSFRFTGDCKDSRKYEGWNASGLEYYNQLLTLVELQRERPGCTFEKDLLTALASKPRNMRARNEGRQQPKARNHMSQLMEMVGV